MDNNFKLIKNNNNNNSNQLWSLIKDTNSLDQGHQSTYSNVNDNLSNQNNLIIIPEQQQTQDVQTKPQQQTINILNNQALLKLFPQLSTVDSDTLQQWFNIGDAAIATRTGGGGGGTGTVSDLTTVQHLLNINKQTNPVSITPQLPDAMPQYQLTLTEKLPGSTANVQSTELMNGMTSIVTPYRGQPAAPVVQVIHMPLTTTGFVPTETISTGVEEKLFTWPFKYVQENETVLPYTKFLVSASNNNYQQQKIGSNAGPISRNGTSGSKQTGSKINANNKDENYRIDDIDSNGNEGETETKPFVNKKINFSYHPILEYIVN